MHSHKYRYYTKLHRVAILLLLVRIAVVAAGVWVGIAGNWGGYLCAGFFAIGIPVFVIQFLPGSTCLLLAGDGFAFCKLFRRTTVPWGSVEHVLVVAPKQCGLKVHQMVGLNCVAPHDRSRLGRGIAKAIAQCAGALPDTYGMNPHELAGILNACLQSARGNDGEQSLAAAAEHGAEDECRTGPLAWPNWPLFTVGLVQRGCGDDDIRKIIDGNYLRVIRAVQGSGRFSRDRDHAK